MAAHDTFVLGYCDGTRALLAHLHGEAPWRSASLCVLDHDPVIAQALRQEGVHAVVIERWDDAALRASGLGNATTVVAFAERIGGSTEQVNTLIRTICPEAQVMVVCATGAARSSLPAPSSSALRVVLSWRFWALVGITIVDGLTFMIPVVPLVLLAVALLDPKRLHAAARFFDDLAESR